jgi:hypothetical protein
MNHYTWVETLQLAQERGVQVAVPDLDCVLPSGEMHRHGVPRGRWDGIARNGLDLGRHFAFAGEV